MSCVRPLFFIVALFGCIEVRTAQPDEIDDATASDAATDDMHSDGTTLFDSGAKDMLADIGSTDMADDTAVANECHAYRHRGVVYDCTVDFCLLTEPNFELRLACCECDPRRYCAGCDNPG